jgi:zinc transport system ATP-binding protein
MNEVLIEVNDLKVSYDGKLALDCPALTIRRDDFIGMIGPNGGGKTTLVKALLKSIPYRGEVVYSPTLEDRGIRRIGYLPQVHGMDKSFPIKVLDVVLSGLQAQKKLFGRYRTADRQKAEELLDITWIKSLKNRVMGDLSGGEFQRVMLCRALISDPLLLILDEPNNFVDNAFEAQLYELLRQFNEKMAIIMVSHDLGTVTRHIKSIVCVNRSVHAHPSSQITPEQLSNYNCPIQLVFHDEIPHTVLCHHDD